MVRLRGDDNGSTTVEIVVIFPAALALVLVVLQAALYWHARDAALSAAQQGLATAEVSGPAAGAARASQVATGLGGIVSPHAQASGGPLLRVQVSGAAPSLLPVVAMSVNESASGPSEAFRGP